MTAAMATPRTRQEPVQRVRGGAVVGLSLLGSAVLIIGTVLPWLSLYGGLDRLRGIDGRNGQVLLVTGVLAAAAALVYARHPRAWLRWLIGTVGFAASGFAAWDLSQLLGTYRRLQADPFVVASLGPGSFLTLAGSLLLLTTLLLPQQSSHGVAVADHAPRQLARHAGDLFRAGVIVFLIGSGMIHLAVFGPHLHESALYAAFFGFAAFAQAGLALLLAVRRGRRLLLGVVVLNALFMGVWLISRTTGLPFGPQPGLPEAVSLPDVMATAEEGLVVILGLIAYGLSPTRSIRREIMRFGATALAITAVVVTAVAVVANQ